MKKIKFKKRRGLGELGNLVIMLLFGILLLTTATLSYTGLITENGGAAPADAAALTGATEAYSGLNATTTDIGKTLKESQGMGDLSVFYVMFKGAFQAVQLLFNVTGIFGALFGSTGTFIVSTIGVDLTIVLGILLGITLVYIIWTILQGGTGRQW